MKIEIIKFGNYYYWLISYGEDGCIEGYAETLDAAVKEIMMHENGV